MSILIYSTSICAACHSLTAWLDKNGITYTKKVIDDDAAAMVEFMHVNDGMVGVPFTVIEDAKGIQTKISGFDLHRFKATLNL